jgi:DNA-binding NtrC family response regulator/tetratricopeptide (TPR) repeat protein
MSEVQQEIEQLLSRSNRYRRRGLYRDNYECVSRALELAENDTISPEVNCRVLIEGARAAYYLSLFTQSESYLNVLSGVIEKNILDRRNVFLLELAIIKSNIYRRMGKYRSSLRIIQGASTAGVEESNPELIVEKFLSEGACYFYLSDMDIALERLEMALGLATRQGDSMLRSRVLLMLGLIAQNKGLVSMAVEYYFRSREISKKGSDYYGEATGALNEGIVLYRQGFFDRSKELIGRARSIFDEIEWLIGLCRCLLAEGNVNRKVRNFGEAEKLYLRAGELAEKHHFRREVALVDIFMGRLYLDLGKFVKAADRLERGLNKALALSPEGDMVVEARRALAELSVERGDLEEGEAHLREALRISRRLEDDISQGLVARGLADICFTRGEVKKGMAHFNRAVQILRKTGCSFELAKALVLFAEDIISSLEGARSAASVRIDQGVWDEEKLRKLVIEANHLLSSSDSDYWRKRAENTLDSVISLTGRQKVEVIEQCKNEDIVRITYSPGMILRDEFVSVSASLAKIVERLELASKSSRPILITGETGTGKELIASMIHKMSDRSGGPFIAVNCASVPDHLFESEFFGHRKGCFTGALRERRGIFREAEGGTLFLDEIGELTSVQQVKLLRVLQEGKIRRIGENRETEVDIRIVSATNQDLDYKLQNNTLRADFLYRINAEQVHIPPLRERREDIAPLIAYCLCGNGDGRDGIRIEEEALKALQGYSWPGNVRELFAIMDRVGHMCNGGVITWELLPDKIKKSRNVKRQGDESGIGGDSSVSDEVSSQLKRMMVLCNGNKTEAARMLGISRGTLYKRLKSAGLQYMISRRSTS